MCRVLVEVAIQRNLLLILRKQMLELRDQHLRATQRVAAFCGVERHPGLSAIRSHGIDAVTSFKQV